MMNRTTGTWCELEDHVYQCVRVILFTLIGTRIMRRSFGSIIPALIDRQIGMSTLILLRAATFLAIKRWEKRLELQSVSFKLDTGSVEIIIAGLLRDRAVNWTFNGQGGGNG